MIHSKQPVERALPCVSFDLQPFGVIVIESFHSARDRSFHAAIFLSCIIFPLSKMRERVNQRDYTCTENFPNQRARENNGTKRENL